MVKQQLADLLGTAIKTLIDAHELPSDLSTEVILERSKDSHHGDFACNIALRLAKPAGLPPRQLAEKIVAALPESVLLERTEIAGPGFINLFLASDSQQQIVADILNQGTHFGCQPAGSRGHIQIEFVSANPTGPLHIGHGRGAAYGAAVANLLETAGYRVEREYYVNDAGRQMDILAVSVWLRYLQHQGVSLKFPAKAYQGDYVTELAVELVSGHDPALLCQAVDLDVDETDDEDLLLDALIARMQELLGPEQYQRVHGHALKRILADIREDLADFGVHYQCWFSEQSLADEGVLERMLERLREAGFIYQQDGAQWFRSSSFGDEKDRVVVRENGLKTYFASDIAYHMNKLERGFDTLIDIWGADHHGYVPRVKAALQALDANAEQLEVLLVQFASLWRGPEKVQMSTRSGSFVTLRELYQETGVDAARFFYVLRRCEQHLDFDLQLAKSRSNENPVYYIQYAHARICSVFRQLEEKALLWDQQRGLASLNLLDESHEQTLISTLSRYPELLAGAARLREPHQLAHYLRELAHTLHTYYNAHVFLVDDEALRDARLCLVAATRQILNNGLSLLGVSAPERM